MSRYFSSNLVINWAMLESGFFLTVEFTAAKISQRFTSDPLSVMFLVMASLIGGNIRQT